MPASEASSASKPAAWSIPPQLKRLFDATPLITYDGNELPQRAVRVPERSARQDIHAFFDAHTRAPETERKWKQKEGALHAFFSWASPEDDSNPKLASFNPGCLRWQAYLVFQGMEFYVVPANNHSSFPSSLPILACHPEAGPPFTQPSITKEGLLKWVQKSQGLSSREEAYMELVNGPIRRAWLYHMYLTANFQAITKRCYIDTQSSSSIVRNVSARELQNAAREDLLKHKPVVDERAVYLEAEQAFIALDTYVTEGMKNQRAPTSLLDAAIFSYVYLLLELQEAVWKDARLVKILQRFGGLREHKERIRSQHYRARMPTIWRQLNAEAG